MARTEPKTSQMQFKSFESFYAYYLNEHSKPLCRAMHYIGSAGVLLGFLLIIYIGAWKYLLVLPFIGYGFAWLGHALFEHNRPATFRYPIYSFLGDWRMFYQFIRSLVG